MSIDVQIPHQTRDLTDLSDEDEILRRIVQGEKDLYGLIMRRYNQRLYRIALSIVNNEADVEDLMQTAYLKAYESLHKFRFDSGFSTWITRILINECLMHLKQKQQISKTQRENLYPQHYEKPIVQTPLMQVIYSELKTILGFAIRNLPEQYRTVFVMRELEHMSVSETMECLGIAESNVKVRLNRAKVMLRDKLRSYINEYQPLQFYKLRCNRVVDFVMKKIEASCG